MKGPESNLAQQIEKGKTPSAQYLIFDQDKVISHLTLGLADIAAGRRVDAHTTYHAFSVTKTFTALAVVQLAEQGAIDLDEPVSHRLPNFPYGPEITVKHLLTHSSGIPNPFPLKWTHSPQEHPSFDTDKFFQPILEKNSKTKFSPNAKFSYSNLGYYFLGQLIEQVAGIPYEAYIEQNIIQRLNLAAGQLGFSFQNPHMKAKGYHSRRSISYFLLRLLLDTSTVFGEKEGKWRKVNDFYLNGFSYGGLVGTPMAFVKYIQALLSPDSLLLSDRYKALLFSENHTTKGKATGMCLSWFKGRLLGQPYFAHAGGGLGYYCEVRIYPEAGLGSAVFLNRSGMTDARMLDHLDRYYLVEMG